METNYAEWQGTQRVVSERPSEDFIRAVADLLETDAEDILTEMGYVEPEPTGRDAVPV
jgi:hypothetical protein